MIYSFSTESFTQEDGIGNSAFAKHDPSTGLNDIKAVPHFSLDHSYQWPLAVGILFILALCLVGYWFKKKGDAKVETSETEAEPYSQALERIAELNRARRDGKVEVRTLAETLSNIVRYCIERELQFPAVDYTPREIERALPRVLASSLPLLPKESIHELIIQCSSILSFCETATFADNADARYSLDSTEFDTAITSSKNLLRKISHELKRENERTRSVVSSNMQQGNA